jgi:LysM repeat protein
MVTRRYPTITRYGAPIVFLAAVTVAVLLVRAGLSEGNDATQPPPVVGSVGGTTTSTTTNPRPGARPRFYRIQAGDTLETVAAEFDTSVEQLLILNPDIDPVALGIGERIRVK